MTRSVAVLCRPPEGRFFLSGASPPSPAPFAAAAPPASAAALDALRALPNASVVEGRVTQELVDGELARARALGACRVVVSGPEAFNKAVKTMLQAAGVERGRVSILEA